MSGMKAIGMERMNIGDPAPDFTLAGVDGRVYSLASFREAPILIVVFSCNHCPYVQAYEDRLIAIQRDYANRGVRMVAINANDDENYPDDSFENMIKRAKEKHFNFPYLRDPTQSVARAYRATHTPEIFVFDRDRQLRYTGLVDDNWKEPSQVKVSYLRQALDALLAGRQPAEAETFAIGCTIKWKSTPSKLPV